LVAKILGCNLKIPEKIVVLELSFKKMVSMFIQYLSSKSDEEFLKEISEENPPDISGILDKLSANYRYD
jgi:hypothetical protein